MQELAQLEEKDPLPLSKVGQSDNHSARVVGELRLTCVMQVAVAEAQTCKDCLYPLGDGERACQGKTKCPSWCSRCKRVSLTRFAATRNHEMLAQHPHHCQPPEHLQPCRDACKQTKTVSDTSGFLFLLVSLRRPAMFVYCCRRRLVLCVHVYGC